MRKCSGGIVFRMKHSKLQVLVVRSTTSGRWTFPKGGVEPNLTAAESAVKEMFEEGGVVVYPTTELGTYEYIKSGVVQEVRMFLMNKLLQVNVYPESLQRSRQWMSVKQACRELAPEQVQLLTVARSQVSVRG